MHTPPAHDEPAESEVRWQTPDTHASEVQALPSLQSPAPKHCTQAGVAREASQKGAPAEHPLSVPAPETLSMQGTHAGDTALPLHRPPEHVLPADAEVRWHTLVAGVLPDAGTGTHESVVQALPSLQSVLATQGAHAVPMVCPDATRQYGAAAEHPESTEDPAASFKQPRKIGATGGAHTPVPVRHTPEAQVAPVEHEGGAPSKQTQSDWMPVGLLDEPP